MNQNKMFSLWRRMLLGRTQICLKLKPRVTTRLQVFWALVSLVIMTMCLFVSINLLSSSNALAKPKKLILIVYAIWKLCVPWFVHPSEFRNDLKCWSVVIRKREIFIESTIACEAACYFFMIKDISISNNLGNDFLTSTHTQYSTLTNCLFFPFLISESYIDFHNKSKSKIKIMFNHCQI